MTVGEVKETFRQVRKIRLEIRHLSNMMNNKELLLLPQAIRYDKDKVQTSPDDVLARQAAEIADIGEQLRETWLILSSRVAHAEKLLLNLDDSDEREVMRYYYLDADTEGRLYTWAVVAKCMGYDERNIYRIHGSALAHLSEKLS